MGLISTSCYSCKNIYGIFKAISNDSIVNDVY